MYKCQRQFQGFERGRLDVLREVKLLQVYGLWTKAKRASWAKKAVSTQFSLKHSMPHLSQASAYYAGRVAGLKSTLTAQYPELCPEIFSLTLFFPVVESCLPFCQLSDCTHIASWECYMRGDPGHILLCECCREKLAEAEAAYRDAHREQWKIQLLPLPVPRTREDLLEVFRRPAPSSPRDWLAELADTPIFFGDPEEIHSTSVGEIAGTLVRLPVVMAPLCWLLLGWYSPGLAILVSFLIALLFAPKWQQREDTHEHRSIFL